MIKLDIDSIDKTPLEMVQLITSLAREASASSLPEFTAATRLTPMVLIDQTLTRGDDDALQNILQTLASIYAAHYLQAIRIADTAGISTVELLDQFATNRTVTGGGIGSGYMEKAARAGMESLAMGKLPDYTQVGLESRDDNRLNEHVNLAIGRLLNVPLTVGERTITMPVSLTINPHVVSTEAIPSVLADIDTDTSYTARFHKYSSGEIDSFMDYLFGLDLIENDKKALMNDETGIYSEARKRKAEGRWKSLLTGRKSINQASTMAVITTAAAEELELSLKGRLKSGRTREKYFETTNSMLLAVVDPRMERLTIYQRGIDEYGMYTYRDIENNGSKSGAVDVGSILKAYKLGDAPTL